MLKLYSEELVRRAEHILKEASHKIYDILGSRSLLVNLKGLNYMNDDPSQVDVLYMQAQEPDNGTRLEQVHKYLLEVFKNANLITPNDKEKSLKLHATLYNTRYRQTTDVNTEEDGGSETHRTHFDATGILSTFMNIEFGTQKLSGVHLSQRGLYDNDGYYHCVSSIKFP